MCHCAVSPETDVTAAAAGFCSAAGGHQLEAVRGLSTLQKGWRTADLLAALAMYREAAEFLWFLLSL